MPTATPTQERTCQFPRDIVVDVRVSSHECVCECELKLGREECAHWTQRAYSELIELTCEDGTVLNSEWTPWRTVRGTIGQCLRSGDARVGCCGGSMHQCGI